MLRQQIELLVQRFQALFGNIIRHRIVDADLQVLQPCLIQLFDALFGQQESVGDHAGDHPAPPDMPDDFIQLRVQERLAAADGDDRSPHVREEIETVFHFLHGYWLRKIIEFIAVSARQVAPPRGNDVHQERVLGGNQRLRDGAQFAHTCMQEALGPPKPDLYRSMRFAVSLAHESRGIPPARNYTRPSRRQRALGRSCHLTRALESELNPDGYVYALSGVGLA